MYGFNYATANDNVVVSREGNGEAAPPVAITTSPRRLSWPWMVLIGYVGLMLLYRK